MFRAQANATGGELWKTDGTPAGTDSIGPYINGFDGIIYNNNYFFAGSDMVHGAELWKTDGTIAGTIMVKDIEPGGNSSIGASTSFTIYNGKLFFSPYNSTYGYELWMSDGTPTGTVLLKDIRPGTAQSIYNSQRIVYKGYLYFPAHNGNTINGEELWRTNGTTAGTVLFKDLEQGNYGSYPREFYLAGPYMYFLASVGAFSNGELYRTDGTVTGTYMLNDIYPGNDGSHPENLTRTGNYLFFAANNPNYGVEPWALKHSNRAIATYHARVMADDKETNDITNTVIYPNPVTDIAIFSQLDPNSENKLTLYDITGKILEEYPIRENELIVDFTNNAAGLYFYLITGSSIKKAGKIMVCK